MARLRQLLLAVAFLTRLPVGWLLPAQVLPLGSALWAFPLVGMLIGAIAGLPILVFGPGMLQAALAVGLAAWLTGALHEDALADFADAAGGRDRETRLAIMRDSRIGSFGTMALICVTAIRIAALAHLPFAALVGAAGVARLMPVLMLRLMHPARADGLGHGTDRPQVPDLLAAILLGCVALLVAPAPLMAGAAALIAALFVARRAIRMVGGHTGDVLGAAAILAETAAICAMALISLP